ncbi:ribosome biogenesis GTPase YlqF [Serpentinimonas barnesii]|uniref:ribosome biogenesis GTPase YlqF n=1 Tax=Serpentinimonas barnesii TaxID=1458427 RepID=UPI0004967D5F|nr:ribosome biogenesis GTPase YlqF [Serpentinimonas barnesii]
MAVQWFPGHMHATQKAIAERLKSIDVVIELLDARLPGSSANPMLARLIGPKPTLKILNKQDLADPALTQAWLEHYNAQPRTRAIGLDAGMAGPARALIGACHELAPRRGGLAKPMRVLIGGIPNVGKSTLINTLVGKRATRVADEAGVTRAEQRILLADDFYLYDTPGVLWPKIIVPESGYLLAASGAVGRNAYDEESVALELLLRLRQPYAALLQARYQLPLSVQQIAALPEDALLQAIGQRRGCLLPGGRLNTQKAAEVLLSDFRSAALGPITLESPQQFAQWLHAAQQVEAERAAERAAARLAKPPLVRATHD